MSRNPELVLKHIEVGGWRLPVWYQTYTVGGITITVRYSRESYVRLSYSASDRHVTVTVPDTFSDILVDEWRPYFKNRAYCLTGARVDAIVGQIFNADSVEEIGAALRPLVEYFTQSLHIA